MLSFPSPLPVSTRRRSDSSPLPVSLSSKRRSDIRLRSPNAARMTAGDQLIDRFNDGKKETCLNLLVILNKPNDHGDISAEELLEKFDAFVRIKELADPSQHDQYIIDIYPNDRDLILTLKIDGDDIANPILVPIKVVLPLAYFFENFGDLSVTAQKVFRAMLFARLENVYTAACDFKKNEDKFEDHERKILGDIEKTLTEPTANPALTFAHFGQMIPIQQVLTAEAFVGSQDTIVKYAVDILVNFKHFTNEERHTISNVLYKAVTSGNAAVHDKNKLLFHVFKHLTKFSTEQQADIKSAVVQNEEYLLDYPDQLVKIFDQFTTDQQSTILNTLSNQSDKVISYAELLLNHFDKLSSPKQNLIVETLISRDKFIPHNLCLLVMNLEKISDDDRQRIAVAIVSYKEHAERIDVPINLNLFSLKSQKAIIAVLLENPFSVERNAGQLLEKFALLPGETNLVIDRFFSEKSIADKCGLDCQVPPMSVEEKLLCLAMLNFHFSYSDYKKGDGGLPPKAAYDYEMLKLVYAVYRPNELHAKEWVLFKGGDIEGIDALKVLNGNTYDVNSLFGRVGYRMEKDEVVFTVLHPVVCHLMQCNPFFNLKYWQLVYEVDNIIEARQRMTFNHTVGNQSTYDDFTNNKAVIVPLLKQVYDLHDQSLVVCTSFGQGRNKLT